MEKKKERKAYKAEEIAQWFINSGKLAAELTQDNTALVSHLKIQKLLYYAQACSLALNNRKLFEEKIVAWRYGPVVENIFQKYKVCGKNGIEYVEPVIIDEDTAALLEFIYIHFGSMNAYELANYTHQDDCFKTTPQQRTIPESKIKADFEKKWLKDVNIGEKEQEYKEMAETVYISSLGELAEYLKNEKNNPKEETVELDWKKVLNLN